MTPLTSGSTPHVGRTTLLTAAAVFIACATLTQLCIAQLTSSSDFSIIVLPDTQYESKNNPQMFYSQTDWIVKNKVKYNIKMVLGEGDIVDDGASNTQQSNADAAIRLLDNAKIPYMLAIGNHDYNGANAGAKVRDADGFNHWWGPARYSGYSYYKGSYPTGSNENFYGVLTINSTPYLFLALEYVPRSSALDWAASVLNANPDKEVMVVTHSSIYNDATRVDRCDTNDLNRDNDGDETWAKFTSQFPHIHLVFSGHITTGWVARRADLGVHGNLVNQMYVDFQSDNDGDGWLRILTFHPLTNSISVSTYSPYLEQSKLSTDTNNTFTLKYRNTGVPAGSTGILSGLVRGDRMTNSYNCLRVAGATVTISSGSATTDSNGHYKFADVVPDTYTITAKAKGWYSATASAKVNGTYTTDENFFLRPIVGAAYGKVINSSGAGIAGATVKFVGGTLATSRSVKTDSTGAYSITTLSVGAYQVTASGSGYASQTKSTTISTSSAAIVNFTM